MAALAKLTILVGAGVAGTLLAKEESLFSIRDLFSGAFKIFRKHLQQDKDSSSSESKPQNEFLLAQVNNLRKQLQSLQSSGSVTIVTGSSSGRQITASLLPCSFLQVILFGAGPGAVSVTAIVVVGAFGYGYIWWKGWRLSDMMFITRRSLSDACNSVGKQLDTLSSSISSTKRHLSSRIDRVDCSLNDCIELSSATRDEVSELHGELSQIHANVENVHIKVRTLETKLGRIEGSQDLTTRGIRHLCEFVMNLERGRSQERIRASQSTRLALEVPQVLPLIGAGSPSATPTAPESSSSLSPHPVETPKVGLADDNSVSIGLKGAAGGLQFLERRAFQIAGGEGSRRGRRRRRPELRRVRLEAAQPPLEDPQRLMTLEIPRKEAPLILRSTSIGTE